jgi:hypothetical protein
MLKLPRCDDDVEADEERDGDVAAFILGSLMVDNIQLSTINNTTQLHLAGIYKKD